MKPVTANTAAAATTTPPNPEAVITSPGDDATVAVPNDAVEATKGTFTVAPGRTIDGKGPGQPVELDERDAERLLDLGFILGPDGSIVIHTEGPKVISGEDIKER